MLTAFAFVAALPALISGVIAVGIPDPRFVVVFGLGLPAFTFLFVASGWFMRSLVRFPGRLL